MRSCNDLYDEIQHLHTLGRTGLTQNPALQLRMNGKGCKRPIGIALSLLGYMLLFERTIPEFCVTYFPTRTVAGVLVSHSGNRMNVHRHRYINVTGHRRDDDVFRDYNHAICCQALSTPEFSISAASTYHTG